MDAPDWSPSSWRERPSAQQPDWPDPAAFDLVLKRLGALPPLVFAVPPAADHPALIVTEGPGWLGRLIIGSEESPLHKRTKFPLQAP